MDPFYTYTLAAIGGILPALVWLWFWLKEDKLHPEPRFRILVAFVAGMLAVGVVIPLELLAESYFIYSPFAILLTWALIEEVTKYSASYITSLRSPAFNEPIDAPIYLLTTALGFAALENVFWLLSVFAEASFLDGIMVANGRFIGATLLHLLSSSIVGIAIAFAYYKPMIKRIAWTVGGLVIATTLHLEFNYLIMNGNSKTKIATFLMVWVLIIIILLFFEKVKRITKEHYEFT